MTPEIVWQDTRTADLLAELRRSPGAAAVEQRCGLPLTAYFAGPRVRWLLEHLPGLRARAERGDVLRRWRRAALMTPARAGGR